MLSVWPAICPYVRVQKLNVGLFSKTNVSSQLKLDMSITTVELYADIPLFLTFDLYLGHKVSICAKYAVSISQEPRMSGRWNLVWI